ncbi:Protein of unknown function [Gryllus bimaculatus]|nr:Protein of unknown function [Gryllus bimaculatus]
MCVSAQTLTAAVVAVMAAMDIAVSAWLVLRVQQHAQRCHSWYRRQCVVHLVFPAPPPMLPPAPQPPPVSASTLALLLSHRNRNDQQSKMIKFDFRAHSFIQKSCLWESKLQIVIHPQEKHNTSEKNVSSGPNCVKIRLFPHSISFVTNGYDSKCPHGTVYCIRTLPVSVHGPTTHTKLSRDSFKHFGVIA